MTSRTMHAAASALSALGGPLSTHRTRCLRCQAEEARFRSLARELASAGAETVTAPRWLVDAVLADIDVTVRKKTTTALASGIAAGTAAVAGAVVAVILHRKASA